MNAAKRLEIFRRLHADNPEPKTALMTDFTRTSTLAAEPNPLGTGYIDTGGEAIG